MENEKIKVCRRCILDTTVPDISFDENGICKYCKIHDELEKTHPLGEQGANILKRFVENIKSEGRGKKYNCITQNRVNSRYMQRNLLITTTFFL